MAAVNGHAIAGGLITALDCDFRIAALATLRGKLYTLEEAERLSFFHEVVEPDQLLSTAIGYARCITPDCNTAYAMSKRARQDSVLRQIEERTVALDARLPAGMSDPGNRRAQDRRRQEIMRKHLGPAQVRRSKHLDELAHPRIHDVAKEVVERNRAIAQRFEGPSRNEADVRECERAQLGRQRAEPRPSLKELARAGGRRLFRRRHVHGPRAKFCRPSRSMISITP